MGENLATQFQAQLMTSISSGATSFSITKSIPAGLTAPFRAVLFKANTNVGEVILVGAAVGSSLSSITRGQEVNLGALPAQAWTAGDGFAQVLTAQGFDNMVATATAAYVPLTDVGAANGVASLDSGGNVPLSELGNAPGGVSSVFGRNGAVVAQTGDYTAAQVGAVATSAVAAANGVASLNSSTQVPIAQVPIGIPGGAASLDGTGNVPVGQLGNALSNPMTTTGDVITAASGGVAQRLAVGSTGQVLTVSGGTPTWQNAASGFANPMTTAGDLIDGGSGGAAQRLAIGSTGQVLTVAGGVPTWANASSGFSNPMTTTGDIITGGSGGTAGRLAIGTTGQILTVTAGAPAWGAPGLVNPMTTAGDLIVGGSSGTPGRLAIGTSGQVPTVTGGAIVWATPGGAGSGVGLPSVYLMALSGSTYTIKDWATGSTTYTTTSAATIAANLGTLLTTSTQSTPVAVMIDGSVNLTGQSWSTHGSGWMLSGFTGGQQSANPNSSPNLGQVTLTVNGASDTAACQFANVTIETETLTVAGSTGGYLTDIIHHNVSYRGVNQHMIVISLTGGGSSLGVQYLRWTGTTCVTVNTSGPAVATQDFFFVTGTGTTTGLGHSFFEYIQHVGGNTNMTGAADFTMFRFDNGAKWHRHEVMVIDLNTNQSGYSPSLVQFMQGSSPSSTQCPAMYFGAVHWEQHQTAANANLVTVGNMSAGNVDASIVIDSVWVNTHAANILTNNMTTNRFTGNGLFLDIRSIVADSPLTVGTWNEDATFPIRIGPCVSQAVPLNSGNSLPSGSQVSSGTVLSLGGSAAWTTGTTYTCGGTPLTALVTGTMTLKNSQSQTLFGPTLLTGPTFVPLTCGMSILIAASGTATFWKAV